MLILLMSFVRSIRDITKGKLNIATTAPDRDDQARPDLRYLVYQQQVNKTRTENGIGCGELV